MMDDGDLLRRKSQLPLHNEGRRRSQVRYVGISRKALPSTETETEQRLLSDPTHSFPGGPRDPLSIVWGGMPLPLPRAETLDRDDCGCCGSRDDNVLGLLKIPLDPLCGTTT